MEIVKDLSNNYFGQNKKVKKQIDGIFAVPKKIIVEETSPEISFLPRKKIGVRSWQKTFALVAITAVILSTVPMQMWNIKNTLSTKAKGDIGIVESIIRNFQNKKYAEAKDNLIILNRNMDELNRELELYGQKNIFIANYSSVVDFGGNKEILLAVAHDLSDNTVKIIDDIEGLSRINIFSLQEQDNTALFAQIKNLSGHLNEIFSNIENSKNKLARLNQQYLSPQEKTYSKSLKEKIDTLLDYHQSVVSIASALPNILGEKYDAKYLLLLQNEAELRATGGFIGTYGIITVKDAKVKEIKIDSIYNPDGQMTKKIEPPYPLKKITPYLNMRDANWDPSFPDAAKEIISIYEAEGGFTPDGVIAIDTKVVTDLLAIVGPIEMPQYDVTLDQNNFVKITQYKTSLNYDKTENKPKQFLADFAPLLFEKVIHLGNTMTTEISTVIAKNIEEKDIQFYFHNEKIEKALSSLNLDGKIQDADSDYFMYINSNISGGKTNQEINEKINHNISFNEDGAITHNVAIFKEHTGDGEWPSGINRSYARFYLPLGSKLISAENFDKNESIIDGCLTTEDQESQKTTLECMDIYQENGKTVIGGWHAIEPGEKSSLKISYLLPFKLKSWPASDRGYSLYIQKQAGSGKQQVAIETNYFVKPSPLKDFFGLSRSGQMKPFVKSFDLTKDEKIEIF